MTLAPGFLTRSPGGEGVVALHLLMIHHFIGRQKYLCFAPFNCAIVSLIVRRLWRNGIFVSATNPYSPNQPRWAAFPGDNLPPPYSLPTNGDEVTTLVHVSRRLGSGSVGWFGKKKTVGDGLVNWVYSTRCTS